MCGLFRLYGLKPVYKYDNNDDSQENEGKKKKFDKIGGYQRFFITFF